MKIVLTVFFCLILLRLGTYVSAQDLNSVVKISQFKDKEIPVGLLYKNCGNTMYVKLGNYPTQDVSFKVMGAEMIQGESHGELTIVPHNTNTIELQIFYKDSLMAFENFLVRSPVNPFIQIFVNDTIQPYNTKETFSNINKLFLKLVIDERFAMTVPADANYSITSVEVSLARGKTLVGKTLKTENPEINLSEMSKLMVSGDRIIVEVRGIERTNFRGQTEDVNTGSLIFMIQIK